MTEQQTEQQKPEIPRDQFGRDTRPHAEQMADYLTVLRSGEEADLRDLEPVWPESTEELSEIVDTLASREHDYGTCVYAVSHASVAAFNWMARSLGITGFQASCADMDILRITRRMKDGFRITNFADLMYPQYFTREKLPNPFDILRGQREHLKKRAQETLDAEKLMAPHVRDHLEWLAAGQPEGEYYDSLQEQWALTPPESEE